MMKTRNGSEYGVSNGWKTAEKCFQWLENSSKKFPMIGKTAEKSSNHWKQLLVLFMVALALTQAVAAQTLGGDAVEGALKIECNNSGMRVSAYLDGTWKPQTFSDNKSSMVHYEQGGTFKYTAGYYQGLSMTCTKNENISSTVNERIWTGGSVQLTMRTIYESPSRNESYEFEIKNTSGSALSNVKFFHGQDTYLGYSDAGGGFWNGSRGVVGVEKPAQDDPSRLIYQTLGSASQTPDDYASANYSTVAGLVAAGALNRTLDSSYTTDNGYAVQWNRSSLAPGETWSISAGETMAVGAALTVEMAGDVEIGTATVVTGIVENAGESASVHLSVAIDLSGWTASINGSTNITLNTGASKDVLISVTCPAVISVGQKATVKLTAADAETSAEDSATITAVYYDGVALVKHVTDDGAAAFSENTDFGGRLLGTLVTNRFTLYNGGPSNITLLTNSLVGSSRFGVAGIPTTLAAGASTNFSVTFDASAYAKATATLTLFDHRPWSPFVMNLSGFGYTISTNDGPYSGGNDITVTAGQLGDGEDVTQVTLSGRNTEIVSQTTNTVTFTVPSRMNYTWHDIVITSLSAGEQTFPDAYCVNRPPTISSVSPSAAPGEGVDITLTGERLSSGEASDVTSVTMCGVDCPVQSVDGTTEIVVRTGAGGIGKGDIVVTSMKYGQMTKYNGFTFGSAVIGVVGINGQEITDNEAASPSKGSDLGFVVTGREAVSDLTLENNGPMTMTISMVATTGVDAALFELVSCPTQVPAYSSTNIQVGFCPTEVIADAAATLTFYSDSTNGPFRLNLKGDCITSTTLGLPGAGGTTVTLSNMAVDSVGSGDMVFFGTNYCSVTAQGTDWMQFVSPAMGAVGWTNGTVVGATADRRLSEFMFNVAGSISNITPSTGNYAGGFQVTITGENLCEDADDVVSVRLAGVYASSIVSACPTQIVVTAGSGFGMGGAASVESMSFGTTSMDDGFLYTNALATYSFSTNAGSANGGNEVTFTYEDRVGVTVTQLTVNGRAVQMTQRTTNSVTFLMPTVFWHGPVTNLTLHTERHGYGAFTSTTNVGYVYRNVAFIGRPDIRPGYWAGHWTNMADGLGYYSTGYAPLPENIEMGPDGYIYVTGAFGNMYGYQNILRWINGQWEVVEIKGTVNCMLRHDDYLYFGGYVLTNLAVSSPVGNIMRYDGSEWVSMTYTSETTYPYPQCQALTHDGTNLYAGDISSTAPNPNVFKYDGTNWTGMPVSGNTWTGKVYALGTYKGNLYMGGLLRTTPKHETTPHRWNGTSWEDDGYYDLTVNYDDPPTPRAFVEFNGNFYYAQDRGDYEHTNAIQMQLLYRSSTSYSPGWQPVPGYHGWLDYRYQSEVRALDTDGEYLFAAGKSMGVELSPTSTPYSCIAAWDGSSWASIGQQSLYTNDWWDYYLNGIHKTPRGIYAVGKFGYIGQSQPYQDRVYATNAAFFVFDQTNGLSPQVGSAAGGTEVTIYGFNLGNGSTEDVYRVTLCGVDVASIDSVSSSQIVVTTAAGAGTGDAVVYTYDYGIITQSNVFTYTGGAGLRLVGLDGSVITNGNAASTVAGTESYFMTGGSMTRELSLVNPGDSGLTISGVQTNGAGASAFTCTWPSSVSAGQTGTVTVVFQPAASGTFTATVEVANNASGNNPFVLNLSCTAVGMSTNIGPYVGDNVITLTNSGMGTVTNVLVGGQAAAFTSPMQDVLDITLPGAASAGVVDIVVQQSGGDPLTLIDVYTYNPQGWINREQSGGTIVGTGTYAVAGTTPNPIGTYDKSEHWQMLYGKNEFDDAGFEYPLSITAVGLHVIETPTYALPDFQMRMASATNETLLDAFVPSNQFTRCCRVDSYRPVVSDLFDMLSFTTPFVWDGADNIVLDTAFSTVSASDRTGGLLCDRISMQHYIRGSYDTSENFTGGFNSYYRPQIRVHAVWGTRGVVPDSGVSTGGYEVVISGLDLSAGDVTNVTLCGVDAAEIISANATQVVVRAGAATEPVSGAVTVYSTSYGVSTLADAFSYLSIYYMLGTNNTIIESGSAANEADGTLFPNTGIGQSVTNVLSVTNTSGSELVISSMSFTGANAGAFSVLPTNLTVSANSTTSFAVVYTPDAGGTLEAVLVLESTLGDNAVNVAGTSWQLSSAIGSDEGGNSITITNGSLMGFGDITGVLVGDTMVVPTAQGENWVTITMPSHTAGMVDITIISTALGETLLENAYSYVPTPVIYGSEYTWEELPGLPQALYMHTAFELGDQLYVAGGQDASSDSVTNVYRFDGYRWHAAPGLPEARSAGAGAVYQGAFYYIGGAFTNAAVTNVYRFDGTNWTEIVGLSKAVMNGIAGVAGEKIVVAGGLDATDTTLTNTYLFDGTNWTKSDGLPEARREQGGAMRMNKLYSFGGRNSGSAATFNQYSFNGTAWSTEAGMPASLFGMGSATLNERVYSFGGSSGASVQSNVYRFNGNGWESVASLYTNLYQPAATAWRGALYVVGGMDMSIPLHTNMWRLTDGGVSPISGYPAGGYDVTIRGTNLCDGTSNDVEWVTLCGVAAEVTSVSATQIVVVAGASSSGFQTGNVEIRSTTYGNVIATNAFTYARGAITLIGTNGSDIAQSDPASTTNGTDFGSMMVGLEARTNIFGIRNTGNASLTLTAIEGAGQGGDSFTVTAFPTNELLPGATGQITVVCASQGGEQLAQLVFRDNVNVVPFTPELGGYTVSVYNVKSYGSGSGLGVSESTLSFNTPYNTDPAAQTFDVSNVGSDPLVFSNTISYASFGENWLSITPTGAQSLTVSGSITMTGRVSVAGLNAGTHTATVNVWCATATNSPQQVEVSLVVTPITQTITWTNPGTQTYTNETLLDATVNSGLAPTYSIVSGPGTLTSKSYRTYMTYDNTGTVVVAASQDGNMNYHAAEIVTQSWEIIGATAGITFSNLTQQYDGSAKSVTVITSPTGLNCNVSYDGGGAPTNVGSYEVIATIDEQFYIGGATNTFTITKGDQTITFPALDAYPTNATVGLTATGGGSGNPVTFAVGSGPGSIDSTNLTFTGIGDVLVVASQAASANYNAAPNVTNLVRGFWTTPSTGPYNGGNAVTITNGSLGTVTNVIVAQTFLSASNIQQTGMSATTFTMPPATNTGLTDITLQTEEYGDILLRDAYTYNPAGEIGGYTYDWSDWEQIIGLPVSRTELAGGVIGGTLYVAGGRRGTSSSYYEEETYRFDGDIWTGVSNMPYKNASAASCVFNDKLYVIGGRYSSTERTNVVAFDGNAWTMQPGLPKKGYSLGADVLNDKIYTVGGYDGTSVTYSNVYMFDGTNWSESVSLPSRIRSSGVCTYNGALYSIGGYTGSSYVTNAYRFDGASWTMVAGLPIPMSGMAITTLDDAMYTVGGYYPSNYRTNVYKYNGTNWVGAPGLPYGRGYMVAETLNHQIVAVGGYSGSYRTNVYRYPVATYNPGVTPSSGSWTGGYGVVISGTNIGNGSDITNVVICGASATVESQLLGRVWVTVGTATNIGAGDIVVQSTSYGTTIGSNVFTYTGSELTVFGTNGAIVDSGAAFQVANGTKFPPIPIAATQINTFSITNSGTETLIIKPTDLSNQTDQTPFTVSTLPATIPVGAVSNFTVTFSPTNTGNFSISLAITNNSPAQSFTLNLGGSAYQMSTNVGPWSGGNTLVLTNGLIGSGDDITNITVGGNAAQIGAQGSNWVEITLGAASTNGGAGDIVIQSTSQGESTFANAYTYNPAGCIPPSGVVTQAVVIGTGSLTNAEAGPGPINIWYKSAHFQFVYTSNDLATAGISGPANITAVGFDVVQTPLNNLPSFLVRMKNTDATDMSGNFESDGLSVCYSNASYNPVAGGFDMLEFATPFEWNGVSNILMDTAFAQVSAYNKSGLISYEAVASRGRYLRDDDADQSYVFTGGTVTSFLPRIRILTTADNQPVIPSSGSWTGGYQVAISGENLGNGSDITNVTLCGVTATIQSQTTERVWITVGEGTSIGAGDVTVQSTSYGTTISSNAFEYTGPVLTLLGTNGAVVESSADFQSANGTRFPSLRVGTTQTHAFSITNTGTGELEVSGIITNGDAEVFLLSDFSIPTSIPVGAVSNFTIAFTPTHIGNCSAALVLTNNSPAKTFTLNLGGSCFATSTNVGPWSGGNTITITNGLLGNGSDITNVTVGGYAATVGSQGSNWVQITLGAGSTNGGTVDIVIDSESLGTTTLIDGYTYHPSGSIWGYSDDWTQWEEIAGLPIQCRMPVAGVLNGTLYSAGGRNASTYFTNAYRFDETSWVPVSGMPHPRATTAGAVASNKMYVVGGYGDGSWQTNVFVFDGTTWSETAGLPSTLSYCSAGSRNGSVYNVGGASQTNVYRLDNDVWTEVAGLPQVVGYGTVGSLGDALYSMGGWNGSRLTNVYRYAGDQWTEVEGLPESRASMGAATMDGYLYAIGGRADAGCVTNVYRFDGTNWVEIAGLPGVVRYQSAVTLDGHIYSIGGYDDGSSSYLTNVYRYPARTFGSGVSPSSGFWTGGYTVAISGENLGDGSDITNVTLCGVAATIQSQTTTRVWVTAGSSDGIGVGDVVVQSLSYGTTTRSNAFEYTGPELTMIGKNGENITSGQSASIPKGTCFPSLRSSTVQTNTLSITNSGTVDLVIDPTDLSAQTDGTPFSISGLPASLAPGAVSSFSLVYSPTNPGDYSASLTISNNTPAAGFRLNLLGYCYEISTNNGPQAGGNTITITSGRLGTGSDIVYVEVCGKGALIDAQGTNWVQITLLEGPVYGITGDIWIQSEMYGFTQLTKAYTYNPATQIGMNEYDWTRWESIVGLPTATYGMIAGVEGGKLYIASGKQYYGNNIQTLYFDETRWKLRTSGGTSANNAIGVVLDDTLYNIGGVKDGAGLTNVTCLLENGGWLPKRGYPLDGVMWNAGAALDGNAYCAGGQVGGVSITNVYCFNKSSWWAEAGLPKGVSYQAMATYRDEVYSIAGWDDSTRLTNVYRFADEFEWVEEQGVPGGGFTGARATVLKDKLYVIGGYDSGGFRSEVYCYDGDDWSAGASLPRALRDPAVATYNDQIYCIGGRIGLSDSQSSSFLTNCYRYPLLTNVNYGVHPSNVVWDSGATVEICGDALGNGLDITNVTLCGVSANIQSQNAQRVWVTAGQAGASNIGRDDVVVWSTSYGTTRKANAFTYTGPVFALLGTNGANVVSNEPASDAKGTSMTARDDTSVNHTFAITNSGNAVLTISSTSLDAQTADSPFAVSELPSTVEVGGVSNITVTFTPTNIGDYAVSLRITNDCPASPFVLNLSGSCYEISTNAGPFVGGNTITVTNGYYGTITNIFIPQTGISVSPSASGSNWFTITLPPGSGALRRWT